MADQLVKAIQHNHIVNTMYLAKSDEVTKDISGFLRLLAKHYKHFCFTRQAKRCFIINNVLTVTPIYRKESEVV